MKLSPEAEELLYQQVDRHVIRRNIAKTLMAGMLANYTMPQMQRYDPAPLAYKAVSSADALLAALEASK